MKFNPFILTIILIVNLVNCELDVDDCPDPESIRPCHCDREGLSCFNELTEEGLAKVFQVNSQFRSYRSVWITQNPIKQLTSDVFNGYRVFNFLIEENDLETVDDGAFSGSYQTIQELSLYNNNISYFPFNELQLMPQLEKLSLAFNKLTTIPGNSFSHAIGLTQLDLSNNQIETIAPAAFFGMKSLSTLLLSNNKLDKIPELTFGSIEQRFQVDLSGNSISFVDPTAFSESVPAAIDLSGNRLTFLDPNIFEAPVRIYGTLLAVPDNPFTCKGCSNYKWLLSIGPNDILGFQCANGRTLSELDYLNIGCFFF